MIKINTSFLVALAFMIFGSVIGQENPILFSVKDNDVTVSEFKYIYEKNNRDEADYSKESIEEYLDLYINFKLKVERAKEMGMHTKESYQKELDGYRKQLADSYVIDREVIDEIVDEIYERKKYDIQVKHILINLKRKANEGEERYAKMRLSKVTKALNEGQDFDEVAKTYSDDKGSAQYGGDIGYMTAALPNGYVELEHAMYTTEVGEISGPIRTDLGYHYVQVVSKRPARGKIEAQHILVKKKNPKRTPEQAKSKIYDIHAKLVKNPNHFDMMAKTLSEDKKTKDKNGELGFFGIGELETSFEDAAFELKNDGDVSLPVETAIGWHIIKRKSKKTPDTKEQLKAMVKGQLNTGERFDLQKIKVVDNIKTEANFKENRAFLSSFRDSLDFSFFEFNWVIPDYPDLVLFNYAKENFTLSDFAQYVKKNNKGRQRGKSQGLDWAVEDLYNRYVQNQAIAYVESQLESRYVEFKNLLREYEEGILLFEITKNEVWDKASRDTSALTKYYNKNKKKYIWEPRADITKFTLRTVNESLINSIMVYAATHSTEEVLAKYNSSKEMVMAETNKVEISSDLSKGILFKPNSTSKPKINQRLKLTTFRKVEKTYPAGQKTLRESRGYVISDYQDQLEKDWIEQLRSSFDVKVNKKVLKSITIK